ncbi:hypothetical protein B0T26DRAFT_720201 [Lasiosphaeria miniovina]|uniref:Uncharacterized protein n=1 Tax=Lasiosphaeria miniovina TaxID=1954250 RepID=A0AA40A4C9_9PEZI|nr:uncharacterized protein B0T26DRAFT_720201 [Lasiosphaeria miniovina]KAK0709029.1 hypothetical protein B0T26DRAFT_720201 [Lasiosphaeria miniovina]
MFISGVLCWRGRKGEFWRRFLFWGRFCCCGYMFISRGVLFVFLLLLSCAYIMYGIEVYISCQRLMIILRNYEKCCHLIAKSF